MKNTLLFLSIVILLHSTCTMDINELKATMKKTQEECLKTHPISKDVFAKLYNLELVHDDNLKKYILCMGRKRGFVDAHGNFNIAHLQEVYAKIVGNHNSDNIIAYCASHPIVGHPVENYWGLARCFQAKESGDGFNKMVRSYWLPLDVPISTEM